jgi:MarR family transcriptional regulator, 2-MHQ and catechol-resistance regulon repressor
MFGIDDYRIEGAVSTYVKLHRAVHAVSDRVEKRLLAEGLTLTQFGVLEAILHKGALSHRELGRKVLTSAANMTDVVDKLAAKGLVQRVRCPSDRRLVRVELTDAGTLLIERIFPDHARDIAAAMSELSCAEIAQLDELLRRLGHSAAQACDAPEAETAGLAKAG